MALKNCCAFTGHRKIDDQPDYALLRDTLENLIENGVDTFYCGMARGFDMIAAEEVLKLKEIHPQIKLVACVSCPEQDKYFSAEEKRRYIEIIDSSDDLKVVSWRYFKGAMLKRNDYMVDKCGYLIAYMRRESGGTAYTVRYARKKKRKIFIV